MINDQQGIYERRTIKKNSDPSNQTLVIEAESQYEGQPNVSVMHVTLLERKKESIQLLFSCYEQHHLYYHQHINLLSYWQEAIKKNITKTRQFCLQTYQYFEQIGNTYAVLHKGLTRKSQAFPYFSQKSTKQFYPHILQGMKGLQNTTSQVALQVSLFLDWLVNTFLPQLRKAMSFYVQPLKSYIEKLNSKRQNVNMSLKTLQKKFQKARKKSNQIITKLDTKKDLLIQQLQFTMICKLLRQDVREWGRAVQVYWEVIQRNECTLFDSLKRDIQTFFVQIQKIHRGAQKHKEVQQFWSNLKVLYQVSKGYQIDRLLDQERLQFLSNNSTGQTFQTRILKFIVIQRRDDIIDSAIDFADILSKKTFQCKISSDRVDIYLYCTVDLNLVFVSAQTIQPIKKFILSQSSTRRINKYSVQVIDVQQGFFVDTVKKQVLHFKAEDMAEQFIHFINAIKCK